MGRSGFGIGMALAASLWAGPESGSLPTDAEIDAAVKELGSDAFPAREAAFARLLAWGTPFPEKVRARLPEKGEDPEIALQCARLDREIARARKKLEEEAFRDAILAKAKGSPDFRRHFGTLTAVLSGEIPGGNWSEPLTRLQFAADASRDPAVMDACGGVCAWLLARPPVEGDGEAGKIAFQWLVDRKDPRVTEAALKLVEDLSQNDKPHRGCDLWYFGELRGMAMSTLGLMKHPRVHEIALARLRDPSEHTFVRESAMGATLAAGDPRGFDIVLSCIGDRDEELQYSALEIVQPRLERVHAKPLMAAFEHLLNGAPASVGARRQTGYMVYELLIVLLGDAGDPAAAPLLARNIDVLDPEKMYPFYPEAPPGFWAANHDLRVRSAISLGKLKAREHAPALLGMLRSDAEPERAGAAEALGLLGDRAHLPALEPLLKDAGEPVRKAAQEAIGRLSRN